MMANCQGRVIGRRSTPPIMITDDHRSVVKTAPGSTSVTPVPPPTVKGKPDEALAAKRKRRTRMVLQMMRRLNGGRRSRLLGVALLLWVTTLASDIDERCMT